MKLTVQEAAILLGSNDERVYDWIEDDSLPAQRIRGQYRINPTELLEWATEHGFTVTPNAFARPDDPAMARSLAEALRAGGIYHRVPGSDLATVLRNVVTRLPLDDDADREILLQILLARKALGLVPIGDGIAIPNVRTPVILATGDSIAALPFLIDPLPIDAPDGKPVDTLFFLICPTVHAHLAMLAKLAFCLKAAPFRDAVRRRASAEDLLRICAATEGANNP